MGTPGTPVKGQGGGSTTLSQDDLSALYNAYLSSQSSGDLDRERLRQLSDLLGLDIEVPATLGEIQSAAEQVYQLRTALAVATTLLGPGASTFRALLNSPIVGGILSSSIPSSMISTLEKYGSPQNILEQLNLAEENLLSLSSNYRGSSGSESISAILRPPRPSVDQLPTPEEFTGEFSNAYAMFISENSAGIGGKGTAYLNEQKGAIYQQYLASLGNFAKFGVSPFYLKEVDRLNQPGAGEGEAAASGALKDALGEGVKSPTTISGSGKDVSLQAQQIGTGVPREFVALPRVDPLTFLRQTLPPDVISLKAQGPTPETERRGQQERGGFVGQPTQIR